MSKLARLTEYYKINDAIAKLNESLNECLSEEKLYECAYNGHIQLSIIIPKNFYYGHILYSNLQPTPLPHPYNLVPETFEPYNEHFNNFDIPARRKVYVSFEDTTYQEKEIQYEYQAITDLWDIPTYTHEGQKSDFLSALHLFVPSWNNSWNKVIKIDLVDPTKEKYAMIYKKKSNDEFFDLSWSFDDQYPNDAFLVIRTENLEKFIQSFNKKEEDSKQKAKPLHNTEKENLLRVIGILLQKGHELEDLNPLTKNKIADLLIACRDDLNLTEPAKTKITEIIQDARNLIPKKINKI